MLMSPQVPTAGTVQFTIQTNEALKSDTVLTVAIWPQDQCAAPLMPCAGAPNDSCIEAIDVAEAPPPPPPPPPCKCIRLRTRIAPSSVKLWYHGPTAFVLYFTLHWQMTCLNKGSGCTGLVELLARRGKLGVKVYHSDYRHRDVHFPGDCAGVSEGGAPVTFSVFNPSRNPGPAGKLGPADWSSESVPIYIQSYCITGWGRRARNCRW